MCWHKSFLNHWCTTSIKRSNTDCSKSILYGIQQEACYGSCHIAQLIYYFMKTFTLSSLYAICIQGRCSFDLCLNGVFDVFYVMCGFFFFFGNSRQVQWLEGKKNTIPVYEPKLNMHAAKRRKIFNMWTGTIETMQKSADDVCCM